MTIVAIYVCPQCGVVYAQAAGKRVPTCRTVDDAGTTNGGHWVRRCHGALQRVETPVARDVGVAP